MRPFNGMYGSGWRKGLLVFIVYFYFLIFGEFAFLELAQRHGHTGLALDTLLAVLGAGGITGSVLTLVWPKRYQGMLAIGLGLCACGGFVAVRALGLGIFLLAGWVSGLGMGLATVSLVVLLARSKLRSTAMIIGWGTGLAYFCCNIPACLHATPESQTLWASLAALVGVLVVGLRYEDEAKNIPRKESQPWHYAIVIVWLMLLVWVDSAMFWVIGHNLDLRAVTWGMPALNWLIAITHLLGALVSGWLLQRGHWRGVLLAATVLLLGAGAILHQAEAPRFVVLIYAFGVSLYSVLLVFLPVYGLGATPLSASGKSSVLQRAVATFVVAGWIGSAMAIGMVQEVKEIPLGFLFAVTLIAGGLWFVLLPHTQRRFWPLLRQGMLLLLVGISVARVYHNETRWDASRSTDVANMVALGRRVYIEEGCIHCHSQYLREGTEDTRHWGAPTDLESTLKQRPPLIGNRRQGPDLSTVGLRRSRVWNELHLKEPRAVVPGSRMPSYAHLFSGESLRGRWLLDYLQSLDTVDDEHGSEMRAQWIPTSEAWQSASLERGRSFYMQHCIQCHGRKGRGDGMLSKAFIPSPRDLVREKWRYIPQDDWDALARVIRYGVPGTSMPGHETLAEIDIASLVLLVKDFRVQAPVAHARVTR